MNLFNFFKNILKKEQVSSTEIMRIRDTISLPKREDLNSNEIELLNKYEQEYINLLNNKVLFSKDLDIDNLKNEMNMYLELILRLFKLDNDTSFIKVNENLEEIEKLNLYIKSNKIIMYLEDILNLKKQVELRLLALEELLEKNRFYTITKKRAIKNKIENLSFAIHTFNTQGEALVVEGNAILNEIRNKYSFNDFDNSLLEEKEKLLIKMLKSVRPLELKYYLSLKFNSIYERIAYLERRLEILVYNHKNILLELNEKIKNFNIKKYKKKLEKFNELELKMRIFAEFGSDLVTKEMLDELYTLKFNIITENIIETYDTNYFTTMNYSEMECYQNLIMKRLERILMGKNPIFNIPLKDNYKEGITLFSSIFKNENNEYSFYDILNNHKLLAFLLSFDKLTKYDFFRDFMIKKEDAKGIDFEEEIFTWDQMIPLETVCRLAIYENKLNVDPLYEFYYSLRKAITDENNMIPYDYEYYDLPNGLSTIRIKDSYKDKSIILKEIRRRCVGRIIHTPKSLKMIEGDFLGGASIQEIRLNDELEIFSGFPMPVHQKTFVVPPSLERIDTYKLYKNVENESVYQSTIHDFLYVKKLKFKYNDLRSNKEKLINILPYFFKINTQIISYSQCNLTPNIFKKTTLEYSVDMSVDSIVFANYNGSWYDLEITPEDLNISVSINNDYEGLDRYELENLILYLEEILNNKLEELTSSNEYQNEEINTSTRKH